MEFDKKFKKLYNKLYKNLVEHNLEKAEKIRLKIIKREAKKS